MYDLWPSNPAFREIFNRTPHPMWVFDAVLMKILAANPAALAKCGYSELEILNLTAVDLIAPEDRQRFIDCLATAAATSKCYDRIRQVTKSGETLYVDMTRCEIDFGGRSAHMVLSVDVTEQVMAEERIQQHVLELEKALYSTVDVIGAITDFRDAHTAGHASRVGRLSAAIGRELGCSEELQRGLIVMGLLHDVGKIGIPVDILTKPKALTFEEYALVRTHVEIGGDIVRRLVFPWPVADVVIQHHERLDGSGYPNALKGEEIRLETRIVSAADVMDSMASHRPYRTALDSARIKDELASGAGVRYDANIANACLRMINRGALSAS